MKKILNQVADVVPEMLDGLAWVHGDLLHRVPDFSVLVRNQASPGQVGLVSGGGSGHEPAHAGFVGPGMLAAAVCGEVFTSPTPDQILEAIRQADQGAGVFLVIKNYSGDVMNFEMAQELAEMEGIATASVIVDDDIAVENSLYTQGRRGVAGTIFVHKILGHAARSGASLEELTSLGQQLVENLHTIGLALSGATVPALGQPGFVLGDQEMEYGVGIHGEPGYRKERLRPSKELAQELLGKLLESFDGEGPYAVLINGLGATPLMEQYIFANDVQALLAEAGLEVAFCKLGNYMTSLDMAGLSLTLLRLADAEWLEALESPVETIAW